MSDAAKDAIFFFSFWALVIVVSICFVRVIGGVGRWIVNKYLDRPRNSL
jgi:hypothetical protein